MATRLYLHAANFNTTLYPGSYPDTSGESQIVITNPQPTFNETGADAITVHRSMDITKGVSETNKAIIRSGTASLTQSSWIAKFISPPLSGVQTSITSQTWISHIAVAKSSTNSNYSGVHFCLYVWRPSNNSLVDSECIYDSSGCGGFAEPASTNTETLLRGNFFSGAGRLISGVQTGDVLICEVFNRFTPGSSTGSPFTSTFYFDGTIEYDTTTTGSTVTDIASYIQTSQNLTFVNPIIDGTSDYKDVLQNSPQQLITNSI